MATSSTLAKVLDRKLWEMMTPSPVATAAAMFIIEAGSLDPHQLKLFVTSVSAHYLYFPLEDAWLQIPSGALGGTFGAGACGEWNPLGPTGTASAGTTTSLTTTLTLPGSLAGYKMRITAGTGAGQTITLTGNSVGANAVLYFDALGSPLDNTSQYELLTGRFYVFNAGTMSASSFKYYDVATNAWTARSVTGAPSSFGTDGQFTGTCHRVTPFATGTATAGTASTISNSGKNWAVNQWANAYQVRITAGTGAGQRRTIASNTATQITVSANWTITPDATSVYAIEGNDDFLYLMGNNAVTLYRYSISGDSWSTLTPGVARAAAPNVAANLTWVYHEHDPLWDVENAIINGRRLYSFRGNAASTLDYYDIPSNAWTNAVTYQRAMETFTTGTSMVYVDSAIYVQKDATGRFFRFDPDDNTLNPWTTLLYPQGGAVLGNKCFHASFVDGATTLHWLYNLRNTGTELFRCMIF